MSAQETVFYYNPELDDWELLDAEIEGGNVFFAAFLIPDSYAACSPSSL